MDDKTIRMDNTNDPSLMENLYKVNQNIEPLPNRIGDPLADYRLPDSLVIHQDEVADRQQQATDNLSNIRHLLLSAQPATAPAEQSGNEPNPAFAWQQEEPFVPPAYNSVSVITNIIVLIASLRIGIEAITFFYLNNNSQLVDLFLRLTDIVLYIGFIVLLLLWVHRAYINLAAFYTADLKSNPTMAALSFLIPIVNLYWPYQRLQEIWKASDPSESFRRIDPYSWQKTPASQLINFWWGIFIVNNILQIIVIVMLLNHLRPTGISLLSGVILNILTIVMVNRITNLQDEKFSFLT